MRNLNKIIVVFFVTFFTLGLNEKVFSQSIVKSFKICNTSKVNKQVPLGFVTPCLSWLKRNETWKGDTLIISYITRKGEYYNIRSSREVDLSKLGHFDVKCISVANEKCKTFSLKKHERECFQMYMHPLFIKFKVRDEYVLLERRNDEFHFIEGNLSGSARKD